MSGIEPVVSLSEVQKLVDGLDHPECVAWDPEAQVLYAGGEAGQIYRIEGGSAEQVADAEGFVLGLAIDADGYIYACVSGRVVRVDPRSGAVDLYSSGAPQEPMRWPNYPAFGDDGSLYVTDSGQWDARSGLVFRVSPEHGEEVWTRELPSFPNGCCIEPGSGSLVVIQSQDPGVWRVPINADGSAGSPEVLIRLPGIVPDGLAYDANGALYISCYRPDRIYRLRGGQLEIVVDDPSGIHLCSPTNIAFIGEGLSVLAAANLGSRHVCVMDPQAVGSEVTRPRIDWAGSRSE